MRGRPGLIELNVQDLPGIAGGQLHQVARIWARLKEASPRRRRLDLEGIAGGTGVVGSCRASLTVSSSSWALPAPLRALPGLRRLHVSN
ncbi:hypothetical protein [Chromobacterium vaccinii]|uniref:hypothetical protein n=1 Tax=Chromobacterium vaccinii TaxID=1108595 RepID=UPI003459C395